MNQIRIVDETYRLLCEVEDGKSLKVWKTGEEDQAIIKNCHYLDEYHFRHGYETFHICQFGEWLKKNDYQVKPYGYLLNYKRYPQERYFSHDYYCLEKNRHAAFYYNPEIEQPFMVRKTNEYGILLRCIPYAGDTFTWVCGYDHEKAEWGIAFDVEKIKNIVSIQLPQIVAETDRMELDAQLNKISMKRIDLQEAYAERDLLTYEERERLVGEIYKIDNLEPSLLREEKLKKEFAQEIVNPFKIFAGKDFCGCDFTGLNFSGYTLLQCDFTGAVLDQEGFRDTLMAECKSDLDFIQEMQKEKKGRENGKGIQP